MTPPLALAAATIACGRGGAQTAPPALDHAERSGRTAVASSSVTPPSSSPPVALGPCNATSCDYATETCCESDMGVRMSGCVSKAAMPDPRRSDKGHKCYADRADDWIGIECMTSLDCPNGLRCCSYGSEQKFNHCTTECEEHEACVPGGRATCPPEFRCRPETGSRSGGVCRIAAPRVACGSKLRCSGEKAGCRYDVDTRVAECVALTAEGYWPEEFARPLTDHSTLLECASKKDCGHERCCTNGPFVRSACMGMCTSGIDVCDSVADCPEFIGPPTGCAPDPEGAPFVKVCQYATARSHTR